MRASGEGRALTQKALPHPPWAPAPAAHLTSCGSALGCSQKAWSSGLSLRMADSEGTRAVTRLSVGRVMPALCTCGDGGQEE